MGKIKKMKSSAGRNIFNTMPNNFESLSNNLYGLSASFLEGLGISGPLLNKVFVGNLDYKVDSEKLKQVFKLAGKVQNVDLYMKKNGSSRGFAVIEYDHPVEAVQAISMLNGQMLFDRPLAVRLDRMPDKTEGLKLPEGLGGVGLGLGFNGEPLKDVVRNLPNSAFQNQPQNVGNVPFEPVVGNNIGAGVLDLKKLTAAVGNLNSTLSNRLLITSLRNSLSHPSGIDNNNNSKSGGYPSVPHIGDNRGFVGGNSNLINYKNMSNSEIKWQQNCGNYGMQ